MRLEDSVTRLLGGRQIQEIRRLPEGAQGASGGEIHYYQANLATGDTRLFITKHATLLERRVITLLLQQRQAVPPTDIPDPSVEGRSCMVQLFARRMPKHKGPFSRFTRAYAKALAAIHAANLRTNFQWVPRGTVENLYLEYWQSAWHNNLGIPEFADEFAPHTERLESTFPRFLADMQAMEEEGSSLTLINADLHPDHMRILDETVCFIDWEQARWGTFYLDLVNYFHKETSLVYRDELAKLGHEIPVVDFLDRFHAMGRYMGFRYLGVGLDAWRNHHQGLRQRYGDWKSLRWFLYYCLELALNGR